VYKRLSDRRSSDDNDGSYVERSETVVMMVDGWYDELIY
jgi:hypothetical protein